MPTYITLINFTDQAIKNIRGTVERQKEAIEKGEKMGAKFKGMYMTMGEYDIVAIYECDNDELAVAGVVAAAMDGNIRTKTLRAFTTEEFGKIIDMIP